MTAAKTFLIGSVILFGSIGGVAWYKRERPAKLVQVEEIKVSTKPATPAPKPVVAAPAPQLDPLPEVDQIGRLFAFDSSKFPIVETVSFTSRVPWLKGRPAWISDYARYFETSRHFIARSLNRKADYFTQKVSPGSRFNVFRKEVNLNFHLLIDLSRCKMWFYYLDLDKNERVLLKTYRVGVGRQDSSRASGYLTPVGKYQIGDKAAVYKIGTMGFFQDQKVEMVRIFGTRWIPFDKEVEGCTEEAKGYGLHGAPWVLDAQGNLVEDMSKIGKYESDGCLRLSSADIEEIYSIVLTKPTYVELVKNFADAKLPGVEK
jgi:hypothetical protein